MIRLSEIEIRATSPMRYMVTSPGGSRIETSKEGVLALLAFDCTKSKSEALRIAERALGADWDVASFFDLLAELSIVFDSDREWTPLFQSHRVAEALSTTAFRSLSEVNLCPSTTCNLNCEYCISGRDKGRLSKEYISSLIKDAAALGANTLNILGDEPTCFCDLTTHCIHEARQCGIARVLVSTNGTRISSELLSEWADSGLTTLQVSIDDIHLGEKTLDRISMQLNEVCDIIDEVVVAYVFFGQHDMVGVSSLVQHILRWPVSIDMKTVIPFEGEKLPCSVREIAHYEQLARSLAAAEGRVNAVPIGSKDVWCGAGGSSVYVNANGDVKPCVFVSEAMGSLRREQFWYIWTDWKRWASFRQHRELPEDCASCALVRHCINGCTARSRLVNCVRGSETVVKVAATQ